MSGLKEHDHRIKSCLASSGQIVTPLHEVVSPIPVINKSQEFILPTMLYCVSHAVNNLKLVFVVGHSSRLRNYVDLISFHSSDGGTSIPCQCGVFIPEQGLLPLANSGDTTPVANRYSTRSQNRLEIDARFGPKCYEHRLRPTLLRKIFNTSRRMWKHS